MSLRRTALARKSQLRRQGELKRTPLARGKGLRDRAVKAARPRDTGPTPAQRDLVFDRAGGCCERCGTRLHVDGVWVADHSFHHRQPRGMGGTTRPEVNSPVNILLVCGTGTTGCHGFIEAHRTSAEAEGWLVRHGQDPGSVPVMVHAGLWAWRVVDGGDLRPGARIESPRITRRVFLTRGGDYQDAAA